MSRIFISYARTEIEFARKLARSLSEMGVDIGTDVHNVSAGTKDNNVVQLVLNECQVMVLIISPDSMASNNDVADQWQYFLDKHKPVIPLLYLPAEEPFRFHDLQHVDFHNISYPIAFDRLLCELQFKGVSIQLPNPNSSGVSFIPTTALLPAPFAWIDISGRGYSIAKYPITNAQFAQFVAKGGYREHRWWTDRGWKVREEGWYFGGTWKPSGKAWTHPSYWTDARFVSQWNTVEQPVVGISWYEAVAFCLWLSDSSGEKIMLPTEDQWQYAAQGDDGRDYPWGNDWDCQRCNNTVAPCARDVTTPVRQYEGKGDSPFGVVDMAGNVQEWCLTDYETKTNDMNSAANSRVLRGGAWNLNYSSYFECGGRFGADPYTRTSRVGFRIARFN